MLIFTSNFERLFYKNQFGDNMRIGFGYDSHRFANGDHLMIGGIKIPHGKGINAHSDGDVLLHALGDALLGAAALGDLGTYFPDTDPSYANIESSEIVRRIMNQLGNAAYTVGNVDATIIIERPRLAKYLKAMRIHIAELLEVSLQAVSVKVKTNEKMGWIGSEQGIAAHAAVLLITSSISPF